MNILQSIQELAVTKKAPKVRVGQTVRVHQRIKEGDKERVQIFEGLVIKINSGHGADKTFTVRKVTSGIGVEKTYPLHSTNIEKIEIKKKSKVRRSKLYYMRERFGKSARLRETFISSTEDMTEGPELAKAEEHTSHASSAHTSGASATSDTTSESEAPQAEEHTSGASAIPTPSEEAQEDESKKEENPS